MATAEQNSRKGMKPGAAADRLANAARLGALGRNLGVDIKRHRDPGGVSQPVDDNDDENPSKRSRYDRDETIVIEKGF